MPTSGPAPCGSSSQAAGTAHSGSGRPSAPAERANRSGKTWYTTPSRIHAGAPSWTVRRKSAASGTSRSQTPRPLSQR
ncbi:Uncharacterised protein [Mycobacteroides abscessus]|nr:Uncharacterised protein [Mycobacteroides abscessus]